MISVIVKSYQRPFLLRVCLESIQTFWGERKDYEVIVADDGTSPVFWNRFCDRFYGKLFDKFVHSTTGEDKWEMAKQGRFDRVIPTCGNTWNEAQNLVTGDTIFLIEDDSYLIRSMSPEACRDALLLREDVMCLIGLRERMVLDIHGIQEAQRVIDAEKLHGVDGAQIESFALLKHPVCSFLLDQWKGSCREDFEISGGVTRVTTECPWSRSVPSMHKTACAPIRPIIWEGSGTLTPAIKPGSKERSILHSLT